MATSMYVMGKGLRMTVLYGDEIRGELLAGMDVLADAVKVTLGPRGRNVAMPQKANLYGADYGDEPAADAPVLVTNDGVTIAKGISLPQPARDLGVQLLREAALRANDRAGDGTTTAIVLAQAVLREAFRATAAGAEPLAVRRGVQRAGEQVVCALRRAAVPVRDQEGLARVAAVSCQDDRLGALVGEAVFCTGAEGQVLVEDSKRLETTLDVAEGIVFDRGLLNPHLATDRTRQEAVLERPYILLTDKKLTARDDVLSALICAAEDGRDCLLVCDGLEGEALSLVLGNAQAGEMRVAAVLAPGYGEGRRWQLDDLAVQTGGVLVSEEPGMRLSDVDRAMLGSAERVTVAPGRTTVVGGGGDPQAIAARVAQLRHYAEHTDYEFNRERYAQRLARFVSGVATVYVGGATEAEQWERKMRVEDAVCAARAAAEEGVVAGGGVALLQAAREARAALSHVAGDEAAGVRAVLEACAAPLAQIARNAGHDGPAVRARVAQLPAGFGFDARTGEYRDLAQAGVVDPLRVTCAAAEAAFSAAGTALLTEAGVVRGAARAGAAGEGDAA